RLTIPTIDIGFLSLDYLGDISQINNKISLSAKAIHIDNMVVDKKILNIATFYIDFPPVIEEGLQKRSIILDKQKDSVVYYTYLASGNGGYAYRGKKWLLYISPIKNFAPEEILAHEFGHSNGDLCDEYSFGDANPFFGLDFLELFPKREGWEIQNLQRKDIGGCPNLFPECCKHVFGVTGGCGTYDDCPGMPYQDKNTPLNERTISPSDKRINFISIMSNPLSRDKHDLNDLQVIYPIRKDNQDYCPLRTNIYEGGCS
ncbi:MAG: hypothetical protein AABY07_07740, partial [Nanoarchaeota archaeon]